MDVVYFSNPASNNTHRFVQKLESTSYRIPSSTKEEPLHVTKPYVLVLPTYGAGSDQGSVPRPVIRFLNHEGNRNLLRGVVGAGNTNFGRSFTKAADIVAQKCGVPVLHRFEILGTKKDVSLTKLAIESLT